MVCLFDLKLFEKFISQLLTLFLAFYRLVPRGVVTALMNHTHTHTHAQTHTHIYVYK